MVSAGNRSALTPEKFMRNNPNPSEKPIDSQMEAVVTALGQSGDAIEEFYRSSPKNAGGCNSRHPGLAVARPPAVGYRPM
jgi:hypothetical protein